MLAFFSMILSYSQETKRVLFLGNSYTYYNNLPNLLKQAANSVGDDVVFDSNTPGGYRLKGHATNTTSLDKIEISNWDYVVLQEQSQFPSFPDAQLATEVFPYAQQLSNHIKLHNPCATTTFYMTWGRENGDAGNCAGWPPVCTYEGMDDLLRQRYQTMANDNNGISSPVGAVWRYLRTNHPTLNLYSGDGSHPSITGSYAGAITFYCALFRKDPTLLSFNSSLSTTDANTIKAAVKTVVFNDFQEWNIGDYDPVANFTSNNINEVYTFTNNSNNGLSYLWDFGDGNTSTDENPTHTYTNTGNFTVTLTVTNCNKNSISTQNITVNALSINDIEITNNNFYLIKNPVTNEISIKCNLFTQNEYQLHLTSILGQTILKESSVNNEIQKIDVSSLASGMYIITVSHNNHISYQTKFLKI